MLRSHFLLLLHSLNYYASIIIYLLFLMHYLYLSDGCSSSQQNVSCSVCLIITYYNTYFVHAVQYIIVCSILYDTTSQALTEVFSSRQNAVVARGIFPYYRNSRVTVHVIQLPHIKMMTRHCQRVRYCNNSAACSTTFTPACTTTPAFCIPTPYI